MKNPIIRRLLIIRLAVSFVLDYRKITRLERTQSGKNQNEIDQISKRAGQRMCKTAFQLQGVIVKVGQFLSMRQDLLPFAFVRELQTLQDNMPQAPYQRILPILERELGCKLKDKFKEFAEEATAAASLAQVHKATLHNGDKVAVKILRPNIERFVKIDLNTLRLVAKIVHRIPSIRAKINFIELHREFTETIAREVNCIEEEAQLYRFRNLFEDDDRIEVPRIYNEYTSRRLLVMQYVEGAKITDVKKWAAWGVDEKEIVGTLLDSYLAQTLKFGFVHLDPHPGNLLVLENGHVCFLDFGMIGHYGHDELTNFRKLLRSVMMRKAESVVSSLISLGYIRQGLNTKSFTEKISQILKGLDTPGGNPVVNLGKSIGTIKSVIVDSPIQLQAKYMFLIRATGILITVLREIAPNTDWPDIVMEHALPIMMAPIAAEEKKEA